MNRYTQMDNSLSNKPSNERIADKSKTIMDSELV